MAFWGTTADSLREAFFMFWETLWALVLGFGLSGAVQALVSRRQMQQVMGDHTRRAVVRSSLLGMASSSCSYAAAALARTLISRGADVTTALVFMVASTNLVLELGLVLWLLIGWQFAAAELVGGVIMIGLMVVVLPRAVPPRLVERVRARLERTTGGAEHEIEDQPLGTRLRSRRRWADGASYTISDLTMLRRELVIGFVVAGFISVAVPLPFWNSVFLHGHGLATTLENAAVGPLVAVLSFVCSIGNVPLAAALWSDGIGFGGVVAFVFADLISLPLLVIYRKVYGTPFTLRLLVAFWVIMSVTGVLVELLFSAVGAVPGSRPAEVAPTRFAWDATTFLDVIALAAFAGILWVHRHRDRFGPSDQYATDPVCGMQVERAHPGAVLSVEDGDVYFCSTHCRDRQALAVGER